MTTTKSYANPESFKRALDDRLRSEIRAGRDLGRVRQLAIFDRFLARISIEFEDAMVLKGGLALELRLATARTTKDVDVRFSGSADQLLARLQRAGRQSMQDFMTFEVMLDPHHPLIDNEGANYEGKRFRVQCKIGGIVYGSPFGLDVGIGDPLIRAPESLLLADRFAFIGLVRPRVHVYPIETHLAEKLHAYTMPRRHVNSRDKDLPDIALISLLEHSSLLLLSKALAQTFAYRGTHSRPDRLPEPPEAWHALYGHKRVEWSLEWPSLHDCFMRAKSFIDPVLGGRDTEARWDARAGEWTSDVHG